MSTSEASIGKILLGVVFNGILLYMQRDNKDPELELLDRRIARYDERIKQLDMEQAPAPSVPTSYVALPQSDKMTTAAGSESYRKQISVGCLPCARGHLAAIWGALDEAQRFALGEPEGIRHFEVQERLNTAEKEITGIERFDWTPPKIQNSPQEVKAVIDRLLPQLRVLRQDILDIDSVAKLEKSIILAHNLHSDLKTAILDIRGVGSGKEEPDTKADMLEKLRERGIDPGYITELATEVKSGAITVQQAVERLKAKYTPLQEVYIDGNKNAQGQ